MTIGGNKKLMNTNRHHQGEKMKSKEGAYARKEPRNLQSRGTVTRPHPTIKTNDQPTTTIKIAKSMTTCRGHLKRELPQDGVLPRELMECDWPGTRGRRWRMIYWNLEAW